MSIIGQLLLLVLCSVPAAALGDAVRAAKAARLERRTLANVPPDILEVFVEQDDAWSGPVLAALPSFVEIGKSAFGTKLPRTRLYLLSNEKRYRRFTKAVFGEERVTGTGNLHIVTMCLPCERRRPDETESIAVVLHEFGHAWMNTYLRERYDRDYLSAEIRRPYLDEGIADFLAARWDHDFLTRRRRWIAELKVGRRIPAPPLSELQSYSGFYESGDSELHYWLSALLIARMLGPHPSGGPKIPRYLDLVGRGATPEQAWKSATGKSLVTEYSALLNELWIRPVSR